MHAAIPPGDSVRLTAWLFITPTDNTGAAFGLLRGYGPFLAAAALIVAVLVFVYGGKTGRSWTRNGSSASARIVMVPLELFRGKEVGEPGNS